MTSKEWKEYKIEDICEVLSSKRIYAADYVSKGIPFYRSKEIIQKSLGQEIDKMLYISKDKFFAIKNKYGVPNENDILVSAVGERSGIPYLVKKEIFYFKDGNLIWLRNFKNKIIDSKYLCYWLKSNAGQNSLNNLMIGSAQRALTIIGIKNLFIPLPSLETQQKIAKVLSAIDDKIELNNLINNNLEQQAQAIFKSWFVDFEPFGGAMPDDWKDGTIEDLSQSIICGKTPSTSKKEYYGFEIPFITIPDMHNNTYITKTERCLSNLGAKSQANKMLPPNSICVSCIATAGLVSMTTFESQTNQQINSIVPRNNISPYYIYLLLKSLSKKIIMLGSSGSTTCNLNKRQFAKIKVIIPNINVLKRYDEIVAPLFKNINSNQLENEQLTQFRDTILPKLMSGEIDVSKVDISTDKLLFSEVNTL